MVRPTQISPGGIGPKEGGARSPGGLDAAPAKTRRAGGFHLSTLNNSVKTGAMIWATAGRSKPAPRPLVSASEAMESILAGQIRETLLAFRRLLRLVDHILTKAYP